MKNVFLTFENQTYSLTELIIHLVEELFITDKSVIGEICMWAISESTEIYNNQTYKIAIDKDSFL